MKPYRNRGCAVCGIPGRVQRQLMAHCHMASQLEREGLIFHRKKGTALVASRLVRPSRDTCLELRAQHNLNVRQEVS